MRYVFISLGWGWVGLKVFALYRFLSAVPELPIIGVDNEAARAVIESSVSGALNSTMVIIFPGLLIAGIGHIMRKNP